MKIKRFKAADMRQAIKLVREEHGADAVILSNRKVKDGIEIISAIDYDENALQKMAPPVMQKQNNSNVDKHQQTRPYNDVQPDNSNRADAVQIIDLEQPEVASTQHEELLDDSGVSYSATHPGTQPIATDQTPDYVPQETPDAQQQAGAVASVNAPEQETLKQDAAVYQARRPANDNARRRDLEVLAMQRELDTLKGLLNSQYAHPSQISIPHIHPGHNGIYARLQELGIRSELCHEVLQQLPLSSEVNEGWRKALALLAHKIMVPDDDILETGGVVALVGSTGVGKTTTLIKLAARFALRHGRDQVAIISVDNYRIAAQEQILSYGRMTGIPVYFASDENQLKTTLSDLYDKQLILIDTAGVSQRDKRLNRQAELLAAVPYKLLTYLVLSANTQETALNQIAQMYSALDLSGCCLTKMDEAVSLGGLLSVVIKYQFPVAYVSEGQRVPEDIQRARPYNLISKSVTMMQQADLLTNSGKGFPGKSEEFQNAYAS